MSDADQPRQFKEGGAPIREQVQIDLILRSVEGAAVYPEDWASKKSGAQYLYRENTIIVRDANLASVMGNLGDRGVGNSVDEKVALAGATRLTINGPQDGKWTIQDELDRIEQEEGPGAAGLDYLFYVCPVHSCAAIEPVLVPSDAEPIPRPQIGLDATDPLSNHGAGVHVRVMDTGLVAGADQHAWMTGVTGDPDTIITPAGVIGQDGGHGTFTAGCVRVTAPQAEVHVVNATSMLTIDPGEDDIGAAFDSDLADLLRKQLIADEGEGAIVVPDILLINLAGTTRGGRPPVALAALYDQVIQHLKELLIIAPAGNEGMNLKTWPSAFSWVVSVGALAEDRVSRATWSNYGRTVDVYAPGDRLVNAFATGEYTPTWNGQVNPPVQFDGMALWSGTSFATPLVAGLIAARMSTTGQSSRRAWASLLDRAEQQAIPGVGPVLYPGQELP